MDAQKEKELRLAGVVAWLRAVGMGSAGAETMPSGEALAEAADGIEAAVPALLQRDDSFEIPLHVTVKLKRPFKQVGKPDDPDLTEINFRPPTAGETKQVATMARQKGEEVAGLYMLHLLSEPKLLLPDIEQRMLAIDAQRCGEALAPFLSLMPFSGGRNG